MLKPKVTRWLIAALVAVALVATGCGSSDGAETTSGDDAEVADADNGLPLASDDAEPLPDEGPCVEGEPECDDALEEDPKPQDLPDDPESGDDTASSSGNTVDGGLSIAEALATDATGTVAIHGHLFDDGTGFRLCESLVGLGERYGCDGEQIEVSNLDVETVPDIVIFEGTTYTEGEITLLGELVSGTLVVDPRSR